MIQPSPLKAHMNDDLASPPPGWYPTPDGKKRYWSGTAWLNLPEPEAEPTVTSERTAAESGKAGTDHDPRSDTDTQGEAATAWRSEPSAVLQRRKRNKATLLIALAIVAVLLTGGGLVAWKLADEAGKAETAAIEKAESKRQQQLAADAEERERQERSDSVTRIEGSVEEMAKEHVSTGVIDGPVIDVSCSPVDGGIEDITATTTVFACFVANKDNGDGTMAGYNYHATMNWTTSEFTYGLGAP